MNIHNTQHNTPIMQPKLNPTTHPLNTHTISIFSPPSSTQKHTPKFFWLFTAPHHHTTKVFLSTAKVFWHLAKLLPNTTNTLSLPTKLLHHLAKPLPNTTNLTQHTRFLPTKHTNIATKAFTFF